MTTRRSFLAAGSASLCVPFISSPARSKPRLSDDGLYQLEWFLESFLDLADDLSAATRDGKRFAILWGLRNCPACRRMYEIHFAEPKIEAYIRNNFAILHLNILGAREVTDFDGSKMSEKRLAARYRVVGTPTIQFFSTTASGDPKIEGREVGRMDTLPDPDEFLAIFRRNTLT